MKKIIAAVLFALVVVGLLFAHSSKTRSSGLSDAETLRQLSRDWADATKAIDVNRLGQIIADDWRAVGHSGKIRSKDYALNYVQTRDIRLESYELGPMDVRMFGNVGVVQGSISQHFINTKDGQHEDYKSTWMDVYERRGDKWVVVRSQITPLD